MLRNEWTFPYKAAELHAAVGKIRERLEREISERQRKLADAARRDDDHRQAAQELIGTVGRPEDELLARYRAACVKRDRYARYARALAHENPHRMFGLRISELPFFEL